MKRAVKDRSHGVEWNGDGLADLDFAHDIALFSCTHSGLQEMTSKLGKFGKKSGCASVARKPRV